MEQVSRLRISDIKLIQLRTLKESGWLEPAWDPGGRMSFAVGGGAYIEVYTDQGLSGIGPAVDPALLPVLKERLVGQDPFEIERHIRVLRYYAHSAPYRGIA